MLSIELTPIVSLFTLAISRGVDVDLLSTTSLCHCVSGIVAHQSFILERPPSEGICDDDAFYASRLRDSPPQMDWKSASELFAMDYKELLRYTNEFFRCYGDLVINKDNSDGLPEHQLLELQKRIRRSRYDATAWCSNLVIGPGSLDLLGNRLQKVLKNNEIPTWPEPEDDKLHFSVEPCTPSKWMEMGISWKDGETQRKESNWQMESYNRLLKDGGRPALSPDGVKMALSRRYSEPRMYASVILPWKLAGTAANTNISGVHAYEHQLMNWEGFRRWQRYNRGLKDVGDFEDFAIRSWRKERIMGTEAEYEAFLEDIRSTSPSILKEEWQNEQLLRAQLQRLWREDCQSFEDYGPAVEQRLTRHGRHRSFKPNLDAAGQDPLTTWIEYMGYMLWWLDTNQDILDEMKAEENLHEATQTYENSILDEEDPEQQTNRERSERGINVNTAKEHLEEAQENWRRAAAEAKLKGAMFTRVGSLREMKLKVLSIRVLIPWLERQIPLIEREMKSQTNLQAADTISVCSERLAPAQNTTTEEEAGTGDAELVPNPAQAQVEPHNGAPSIAREAEENDLEESAGANEKAGKAKMVEEEAEARRARAREARKARLFRFSHPTSPTRRSERIATRLRLKAEEETKKAERPGSVALQQLSSEVSRSGRTRKGRASSRPGDGSRINKRKQRSTASRHR